MKRFLFLIGVCCLTLAFLSTGAELAARAMGGAEGEPGALLMPLSDVWRAVAPGSFLGLLNSDHWTVINQALFLPGWLLFGLPGFGLVIIFHKRDPDAPGAELEESLFLFDELARAAKEEGYTGQADDMAPAHPTDLVPAEEHYAINPVDPELLTERDYLLNPAKPTASTDKQTS